MAAAVGGAAPPLPLLVSAAAAAAAEARAHSDWAALLLTSQDAAAGNHFGSIRVQLESGQPFREVWAEVSAGMLWLRSSKRAPELLRAVALRNARVSVPRQPRHALAIEPDGCGDQRYVIATDGPAVLQYWRACVTIGASNHRPDGETVSRGWWQSGTLTAAREQSGIAERTARAQSDARHQLQFALEQQDEAFAAVASSIAHGADIDAAEAGTTSLLVAAREGELALLRQLLQAKPSVDATGADGRTPLMVAAAGGHEAVVDALLRAGAQLNQEITVGTDQDAVSRAARSATLRHGSGLFDRLLAERQGIESRQVNAAVDVEVAEAALEQATDAEARAVQAWEASLPVDGSEAQEAEGVQSAIAAAEERLAALVDAKRGRDADVEAAQKVAAAEPEAVETAEADAAVEAAKEALQAARQKASEATPQTQKELDQQVFLAQDLLARQTVAAARARALSISTAGGEALIIKQREAERVGGLLKQSELARDQLLKLADCPPTISFSVPEDRSPTEDALQPYAIVSPGETPQQVSAKLGVTVEQLAEQNPWHRSNPTVSLDEWAETELSAGTELLHMAPLGFETQGSAAVVGPQADDQKAKQQANDKTVARWIQLNDSTTGLQGLCDMILGARERGLFPEPSLQLGHAPIPVAGKASADPLVPKFENQWRANHFGALTRTAKDSWFNGHSAKVMVANNMLYRKLWAGPNGLMASSAKVPEEGTGLWDKGGKNPDGQRTLVINLIMVKALQDDKALDVPTKRAELDQMSTEELIALAKHELMVDLQAHDTTQIPGSGPSDSSGGYYDGVRSALRATKEAAAARRAAAELRLAKATTAAEAAVDMVPGDISWTLQKAMGEEMVLERASKKLDGVVQNGKSAGSSHTNLTPAGLRERAQALLAIHGSEGGGDSNGTEAEEEESEEDAALWRTQMAEQAAAGNLDVADLADVGSLPTLLKLLEIPTLQSLVCATVAEVARVALEPPPNVSWGQLLRPLLQKMDRSVDAQLAVGSVVKWIERTFSSELSGGTALTLAVAAGHTGVVRLLLLHGADPSKLTQDGKTLIELARAHGHGFNVGQVITDHIESAISASVDSEGQQHHTGESGDIQFQFGAAVLRGDEQTMLSLLAAARSASDGIVKFVDRNRNNTTPLHIAAAAGQQSAARLLIERGADVNAVTFDGCTPLHVATGVPVTLELLRHGADTTLLDKNGMTAAQALEHEAKESSVQSAAPSRAQKAQKSTPSCGKYLLKRATSSFRRSCSEAFASEAAKESAEEAERWIKLRNSLGDASAPTPSGGVSGAVPFVPPRNEAEIRAQWQGRWLDEDVLTCFYKRFAPALAKPKPIANILCKHRIEYRGQDWRKKMYRRVAKKYGVDPRVLWLERQARQQGGDGGRRHANSSAQRQKASKVRERAQALLAIHGSEGGGDSNGTEAEEEESEEDAALWRTQMAEQAAAGNLDVADLADVGSLPTLLKLLEIPTLQSLVCRTIAQIATAAAAEPPPNVSWGQLLRPLLQKMSPQSSSTTSSIAHVALSDCAGAILAWSSRCTAVSQNADAITGLSTEHIRLPTKSAEALEITLWANMHAR